jgi:glycosyltransferase involved in cell wall biosynthesis
MRQGWPGGLPEGAVVPPVGGWPALIDDLLAHHQLHDAAQWMLEQSHPALAMALVEQTLARRREPATLRIACRVAFDAAWLEQASDWGQALEATLPALGPADLRLVAAVRERRQVLDRLDRASALPPSWHAAPDRALSLLAYSLPYTSNGYATRSHGLLSAVRAAGWEVYPFTRPGYPADSDERHRRDDLPAQDPVGTLVYGRLFQSSRRHLGHMAYVHAAADEIRALIERLRPAVVHAASNYMTALPACLAARESGLPFVYEVRGFWDVTRASSSPAFHATTEARHLRMFESALLARADAIVTLTESMKFELVRRGAPARRVFVAPNAVDVDRLTALPRDEALAARLGLPAGVPVIGYVGSFVEYEGLDDLVDACAVLRSQGNRFHLLLVGDGSVLDLVRQRVHERGLDGLVTLTGRVPHDDVASYYSLIDICPFPRKPWPVCELVSPLKPLEAMALEKAVVVSDVAALAEMIRPGETGWTFAKGSVTALAARLQGLIEDPASRSTAGKKARHWVSEQRTWARSARTVIQAYRFAQAMRSTA